MAVFCVRHFRRQSFGGLSGWQSRMAGFSHHPDDASYARITLSRITTMEDIGKEIQKEVSS